jgi:hypothetical protein
VHVRMSATVDACLRALLRAVALANSQCWLHAWMGIIELTKHALSSSLDV